VPDGTIPVAALGFTAGATIYAGAMININTYTLNNDYDVLNVETSTLTPLCELKFNTFSPNVLEVTNPGGSTGQSSTISGGWVNGKTYYVKLEAVVGSGANAACTAQLSTDGATWGYTATSTNGTWTTNTGYVEFDQTGTAAINKIVDDVRASTSTFNYW